MFSNIKAVNLFSWEKLDYDVPPGLSQVTGWNEDDQTNEASGKSSTFNILSWVLFGAIPKDAKIDEVVRAGSTGKASGTVELDNGWVITRVRRPNDLYLIEPTNKKVIRGKDAKDTQALIQKQLGFGFDVFCQTLYFAQNDPNRFITASEADKSKILSEVLDLAAFDRARAVAAEEAKKTAIKLAPIQRRIEATEDQITSNKDLRRQTKDAIAADLEHKKAQKDKIQARIEALELEQANLRPTQTEDHTDSLNQLMQIKADLKSKQINVTQLKEKASEILDLMSEVKDEGQELVRRLGQNKIFLDEHMAEQPSEHPKEHKCPTCSHTITSEKAEALHKKTVAIWEKRHAEITELIPYYTKAIYDRRKDHAKLKAQLADLSAQIKDVDNHEDSIREIDQAISEIKREMQSQQQKADSVAAIRAELHMTRKQLASLDLQENPVFLDTLVKLKDKLRDLSAEREELTTSITDLQTLNQRYETLKKAFTTVKKHVFVGFLAELTAKTNKNLETLFDQAATIQFTNIDAEGDTSKITTFCTIAGRETSQGLMSGGQARRFQLATDLAISEAIGSRTGLGANFRVLDEPFKDLSDKSIERCIDLIKELPGVTILIEHNYLAKNAVEKTFHCTLSQGISRS